MVNLIKSQEPINTESNDWKYLVKLYETFRNDLKVLDLNLYSDGAEVTFGSLLIIVSKIRENVVSMVSKAINKDRGVRLFFLTHTIFNQDDKYTRDPITKAFLNVLQPTDEDLEFLEKFNAVPEDFYEVNEKLKCDYISPYDDDILVYVGLWNRDENDKLRPVIDIVDTVDFPDIVVDKITYRQILDSIPVVTI